MNSPCRTVILLYTSTTVVAFFRIDNILALFFRDSSYRALVKTAATLNTIPGNKICQDRLLVDMLNLINGNAAAPYRFQATPQPDPTIITVMVFMLSLPDYTHSFFP
jgi:hypothetical protein